MTKGWADNFTVTEKSSESIILTEASRHPQMKNEP